MKKNNILMISIFLFLFMIPSVSASEITLKIEDFDEVTFTNELSIDYSSTQFWNFDATTNTLNILPSADDCEVGSGCKRVEYISVSGEISENLNIVINGGVDIYSKTKPAIESLGPSIVISAHGSKTTSITSFKNSIKYNSSFTIKDTANLNIKALNDESPIVGTGELKIDNSFINIYSNNNYGIDIENGKFIINASEVYINMNTSSIPLLNSVRIKSKSNPFVFNEVVPSSKEFNDEEYYYLGNEKNNEIYGYNGVIISFNGHEITNKILYEYGTSHPLASIYATNKNGNKITKARKGDKITIVKDLKAPYLLEEGSLKVYYYEGNIKKQITLDENNSFIMPDKDIIIDAVIYDENISKIEKVSLNSYNNTIYWSGIDYASFYEVYRSSSSKGSYKLVKTTTETSYRDTDVTLNGTYYYKVRAYRVVNGEKVYGPFSSVVSKTVKIATPKTLINSSDYDEATIYLEYQDNTTGFQIYRYNGSSWVRIKNVGQTAKNYDEYTTYTNSNLKFNKTYKYKVRAYKKIDGKYYYSDFSQIESVKTMLQTPVLNASYVNNSSVKVSWNKVTKAKSYNVYLYKDDEFKLLGSTTNTNYLLKSLPKNSELSIAVEAVYSKYKSNKSYINVSTVPVPLVTFSYVDFQTMKAKVQKNSSLSKYEICIKEYSNDEIIDCQINETGEFTFENLNPNIKYGFSVYGIYENKGESVYSHKVYKEYTPKPAKTTITLNPVSYKEMEITWKEVQNVDGYQVYRSSNNKTWTLVSTTTELSYLNKKLKTGTKYYYKVRAFKNINNKTYYGGFSSVKYGILKVDAPTISHTITTYAYIKTSWGSVPGASGYLVYRSTDGKKYSKYISTTNTYLTDKSITLNKTYYYKVRAYRIVSGKKYYGNYSNVISSKAILNTPNVSIERNGNTITISYEKVSGATGYNIYVLNEKTNKYNYLKTTKNLSYSYQTKSNLTYKVRAYRTISGKNYYSSYSKSIKIEA